MRLRHRAEFRAVHLAAASAAGCAVERAGDAQPRAAPGRVAEGAAQERGRQPRPGRGATRPGQAQSVLYDGHRRPAGRVVSLSAAVGQFAQAGTNLTMFVPDQTWVTANFKEIQLDKMRPGEKVTMKIDAYPGRTIQGHVESVQPGSGTAFSLLPAQNATGNYVKIVQRVPVKIVMDNPPADVALGPGMSVVPTVRINPAPSLFERLEKSSLGRL
ncbi:efflux RND transporter periplasmic adaptor subunit [Bradyrhizobium brasilense]|uniref:efflux RND transporter periplasmic adaptor subunit n=1 Tax=Bradyrhizobium brasilense TaxID=1419277 RepID=UPI0030B8BAC4